MTEILFPDAIYFDANALRALKFEMVSPELAELQDLVSRFGLKLCIPSVAINEVEKARIKQAKDKIQKLNAHWNTLKSVIELDGDGVSEQKTADMAEKVKIFHSNRIKELGFETIDIPQVELAKVYKKFFEDEGAIQDDKSGFKDVIIFLSILWHASKVIEAKHVMLSSSDKFFRQEGINQSFEKLGIKLILVDGPPDAIIGATNEKLEHLIKDAGHKIFSQKQEIALAFLKERQAEIFDYVLKNAKVNMSLLKWPRLFQKRSDEERELDWSTIESVVAVQPVEIRGAFPGFPESDEPGRYSFNFNVACEFTLKISQPDIDEPAVPLSDIRELVARSAKETKYDRKYKELKLMRELYVQASVASDGAEEGRYQDFKLEKVL